MLAGMDRLSLHQSLGANAARPSTVLRGLAPNKVRECELLREPRQKSQLLLAPTQVLRGTRATLGTTLDAEEAFSVGGISLFRLS